MPRQTRNWSATESTNPVGADRTLKVVGEVETFNSNETPALAEAVPQGPNHTILILDLTVTSSGTGLTVMGWDDVSFSKAVSEGQYRQVTIRQEDGESLTIEVEMVES
jgi:hypothetical protein